MRRKNGARALQNQKPEHSKDSAAKSEIILKSDSGCALKSELESGRTAGSPCACASECDRMMGKGESGCFGSVLDEQGMKASQP